MREVDSVVTLPANGDRLAHFPWRNWACDPENGQLGDLLEVLKDGKPPMSVMLGAGDGSRFPKYADCGKPFIPVPGRAETIVDLMMPRYEAMLGGYDQFDLLVSCGDSIITASAGGVLDIKDVDIAILSIRHEQTNGLDPSDFGVLVIDMAMKYLVTYFQKPERGTLENIPSGQRVLIDTGVWLFSPRAVDALMAFAWRNPKGGLYRDAGPALLAGNGLSKQVVELPRDCEFWHLGTEADYERAVLMAKERAAA